jgi:SAM-dependent methyltransferase
MDEATKTKMAYPELITKYIHGNIIDIGAGLDPIDFKASIFDLANGDAQFISKHYETDSFDTVFSSHCLEHMVDPSKALEEWVKILKPGGVLFVIVPDEDLYEQGHFPSIFNSDHKATFSISKSHTWSPRSFNIYDLAIANSLKIEYLRLQSDGYDYSIKSFGKLGLYRIPYARFVVSKIGFLDKFVKFFRLVPVDQTANKKPVLAQICLIARKK